MDDLPNATNFYSALHTTLSREQITELYAKFGWQIRKCSRTDYEIIVQACLQPSSKAW